MIITKKEEVLYTIVVNQEELDIITDSISATNIDLSEEPEVEEQEVKKREQLLRVLEPFAKVVCIYSEPRNETKA